MVFSLASRRGLTEREAYGNLRRPVNLRLCPFALVGGKRWAGRGPLEGLAIQGVDPIEGGDYHQLMNQDKFLQRLRESLRQGEVEPPARPVPYEPPEPASRAELMEQFTHELEAVGGQVHHVSSLAEARSVVLRIVQELGVHRIVRADTADLTELDLDDGLKQVGVEVTVADLGDESRREPLREASFVADAGITFGDYGVAETGTLALLARRGQGRVVSLLPPVHIALLRGSDIVAELAALMERVAGEGEPPSALTFITGPSRTGDIELVLTVGVHGPKELHAVLVG